MNSKSKRKFRAKDNVVLLETLQKTMQIVSKIEGLCDEHEVSTELLPDSKIPTHILYDIAVCFEEMYFALLDEELVQAGYTKQTNTQH
jgi:hypothetical protein